jgi:RNA polymerase-binding transcription factor DksA
MAVAAADPAQQFTFRLFPDGSGQGNGPDGALHTRFRAWKEALRDTAPAWRSGPGAAIASPRMDAQRARELVLKERERIEALVREREAEGIATEPEGEQMSELAAYDQHQADLGTETFEREKDFSLLEQLEAELDELERALGKIEEGTYGICEACGKEIPPERLEAMPGTRLCVEDQARRG